MVKRISALCLLLGSLTAVAQNISGDYDDYGVFATDPLELDQEVQDLFGRYFQTTFALGSAIPTGDIGAAYSAGFMMNLKFILYMDRIWAWEVGGGFSRLSGNYNESNTGRPAVAINLTQTMIPFEMGFRYGFDLDNLPQGIAMMNPYVSAGPGIVFRSENVKGSPETSGLDAEEANRFLQSSTRNTTGWILHGGGGVEFDVYRKKVFAGIEARYHAVFWSDSSDFVGNLGRRGHFFTLLGTLTHNY